MRDLYYENEVHFEDLKGKIFMKMLKDIFYIHYYHKKIINRMLVIGILRGIFGFTLFIYITWRP